MATSCAVVKACPSIRMEDPSFAPYFCRAAMRNPSVVRRAETVSLFADMVNLLLWEHGVESGRRGEPGCRSRVAYCCMARGAVLPSQRGSISRGGRRSGGKGGGIGRKKNGGGR